MCHVQDEKFPFNLPLSDVAVISRNSTRNTAGAPPEAFPRDGQALLQLAGVYYAGRIAGKFGALAQYNYDGIEHKTKAEMLEFNF